MWHRLNCGRAGSDDADSLIRESRHAAACVASRVFVVPTAGVEGMTAEALYAGNAGQTRFLYEAACRDDKARSNLIIAVRRRNPASALLIPAQVSDEGLKQRARIQIIALREFLAVGQDLRPPRILLTGDIARLLEEGHVYVRFDVA